MNRRIVRSPEAEIDLAEMADRLARSDPRLASRFLDSVQSAFAVLADFPEIGGISNRAAEPWRGFEFGRSLGSWRT